MNKIKISILVYATLGLFACSTESSFKVNQELTSPYITQAQAQHDNDKDLATRLGNVLSKQFPLSKIKVVVNNNDVLLVGQVKSNSDSIQAESVCKKWPGTEKVFNYLTLSDKPTLNTSSFMASDAQEKVKGFFDINFEVMDFIAVDNVIYIMGTNVGNLTALDTAIERMYSIPKVTKVVNLEQRGEDDYDVQK